MEIERGRQGSVLNCNLVFVWLSQFDMGQYFPRLMRSAQGGPVSEQELEALRQTNKNEFEPVMGRASW